MLHPTSESEALAKLALDASGAGVWLWDAESDRITIDQRYRELYGFAPDEVVTSTTWQQRLMPEDRDVVLRRVAACLAEGERWHEEFRIVHPTLGVRWLEGHGRVRRDAAGRVLGLAGVNLDVTERKSVEETQRLLLSELNHRVKNTLATVQAMAEQTLRYSGGPEQFVDSFRGRLQALACAHNLLTKSTWAGVSLDMLISEQLLLGHDGDAQISCEGPAIELRPQVAVHLGLVLHELGTNARKYGALSVPDGRLVVTWCIGDDGGRPVLDVHWRESGGPIVSPPETKGFGTMLVEMGTRHTLRGTVRHVFARDGVVCDIRIPNWGDKAGHADSARRKPAGAS